MSGPSPHSGRRQTAGRLASISQMIPQRLAHRGCDRDGVRRAGMHTNAIGSHCNFLATDAANLAFADRAKAARGGFRGVSFIGLTGYDHCSVFGIFMFRLESGDEVM